MNLMGCDQCGGVADPSVAEREWFSVAWAKPGAGRQHHDLASMLRGASEPPVEMRAMCSLECIGVWAASHAAVARGMR